LFEESLKAFREVGDDHYTLLATDALAWTYGELGDRSRRRALHEENLSRARTQCNERVVALTLEQLARFAADEGRVDDALNMLKESLCIYRDLGDRGWIATTLGAFAEILAAAGKAEAAARLLSGSEALRNEIGGGVSWLPQQNERTLSTIRTQLDEAAFAKACEQGRAMSADDAVALALDS